MSNLGLYQLITQWSKKVGGPRNFLILVASAGALSYKGLELIGKKIYNLAKKNKSIQYTDETTYTINKSAVDNQNLEFNAGDKFKVLETDGTAILIEKMGDKNNPYYVSANFLRTISNWGN